MHVGLLFHSPFVAESVAARLSREVDFSVMGLATNVADAVELAARTPHLLIGSPGLSDGGLVDVAMRLKEQRLTFRMAMIAREISVSVLDHGLAAGIRGFILDDEPASQVVEMCRIAARGELICSARIRQNLREVDGMLTVQSPVTELNTAQFVVLRHLALGRSTKEVSRETGLSLKSVDSHKYRLMKKLDIHDRVELCLFAIRHGIIDL